MNLARDGNLIEAAVWFVFALVLFIYVFRREWKGSCVLLMPAGVTKKDSNGSPGEG